MNILYCGDSNIEIGMKLSILSILEWTKEPVNVYVLTMGLETEKKIYTPVSDQCIHEVDQYMKNQNPMNSIVKLDVSTEFLAEVPMENLETRFTPFCMLRLFADQVEALPDKILYLDNDVLCRGKIHELYQMDVSDYEYIGVLDHYGSWFFRKKFYQRDYVNSGVLLLNMKKIKETGLFEKCRVACREKKMFMPDQTALNQLAQSKKLANRRFNEQRQIKKDTVLQHFTTSFRLFPIFHYVTVKPWMVDEVHRILKLKDYDELFDKYESIFGKMDVKVHGGRYLMIKDIKIG